MKPESQRIAIAEACGRLAPGFTPETLGGFRSLLPDYLNSLDAMHEAEKSIPDRNLYRKFLFIVVLEDPLNTANEPAFSTATQRAEAFLKTLNLWTDET